MKLEATLQRLHEKATVPAQLRQRQSMKTFCVCFEILPGASNLFAPKWFVLINVAVDVTSNYRSLCLLLLCWPFQICKGKRVAERPSGGVYRLFRTPTESLGTPDATRDQMELVRSLTCVFVFSSLGKIFLYYQVWNVIRLLAQTRRVTFLVSDCLAALAISPRSVGHSFIYLSSHSMLASIKEVPKSLPTAKSYPCPGGNHSFANTCTVLLNVRTPFGAS